MILYTVILLALCRDEAWAEEITQEAFFKALKKYRLLPRGVQAECMALPDRQKLLLHRSQAPEPAGRCPAGNDPGPGGHGTEAPGPGNGNGTAPAIAPAGRAL